MKRGLIMLVMLVLLTSCSRSGDNTGDPRLPVIEPWVGNGQYSILVDAIHQWEARPDFVFDDKEFRYCHSQSVSRLMSNLIEHDFKYREIREGRLTPAVLAGHDVLFINVPTFIKGGRSKPDRKLPRLSQAEIDAIIPWVAEGGGLFVIAEHNNAYDNAEVLNPLLRQVGIEVPAAYAIEKPWSKYSFNGSGCLISIWNYKDHPITTGLRATSWLGGAPLTTEHGVGFLSDEGHVDLGNYITHEPMKHSNRKVDPGEYKGPGIPVIAATEHGKGRVVVIGDHNMVGIQWLGVADNYRFALNSFTWLAGRDAEIKEIAYSRPRQFTIGVDLSHSRWNIGARDRSGYHAGFLHFSRLPDIMPLGLLDLEDPADVLMFLDPSQGFSKDDFEKIRRRLVDTRRIVLVMDPSEPQRGSVQLLNQLVPELRFVLPRGALGSQELLQYGRASITRLGGKPLPAFSEALDVGGLEIAALQPPGYKGRGVHRRPKDIGLGTPYLLDLSVNLGEPLVTVKTPDGRDITVIQRIPLPEGELILMPQGKMWSNETHGAMRDEPFNHTGRGAYELQLKFASWLAHSTPRSGADQPHGSKMNPMAATAAAAE